MSRKTRAPGSAVRALRLDGGCPRDGSGSTVSDFPGLMPSPPYGGWSCQTGRNGCSREPTQAGPLDLHFLSLRRHPTSGTRSSFRFVNTTHLAPAKRCWFPVSGLEAPARVWRFGSDRCHLTHRLSGWATLGKHPRNLEKISMPGSFPRPTPHLPELLI